MVMEKMVTNLNIAKYHFDDRNKSIFNCLQKKSKERKN